MPKGRPRKPRKVEGFVIDQNVPVPAIVRNAGTKVSPLGSAMRELKTGESLFVEKPSDMKAVQFRNRISSFVTAIKKRTGNIYATRSVEENGEAGIRVWRVE